MGVFDDDDFDESMLAWAATVEKTRCSANPPGDGSSRQDPQAAGPTMGRAGTASVPPQRPAPQPAACTAAAAQSAHAEPAHGQRLPDAGQPTHAPQTAGTATAQQPQASTHRRPALRHQAPAAVQHQHQPGGTVQSPGLRVSAPGATVGEKYVSRTPRGGPHIRSIFYHHPKPTAAGPPATSGGAAERAGPEAHGGDGSAQRQAPVNLGSGHGRAASAASHLQATAQQPSGAPPQRLVLPAPDAVLGSTRQPNNLSHSNPAGQVGSDYAGQRRIHSAPSAAVQHQLHQRPTLQAGQSGAADGHVPQAIRSAPAGPAVQSTRPMFQHQQQQPRTSPQKQQQQQTNGSGTAFQQFACDVQRSISASKSASARSAQPASPAAATGGATKQQRILPSLMRGGARPVPPPARPGNEFCAVEIQLGEQTGTLEVHAKDRYFNDAVQTAMLRMEGAAVTRRWRAWRFAARQFCTLRKALDDAGAGGMVEAKVALPDIAENVLEMASKAEDESERYERIPAGLRQKMMPFQREGVRFALAHGGRVLIGDEMGLGKTVQALAVAAAYKDDWPGLIITPSSLRLQWADALHQWLGITEDRVHVVTGKHNQSLAGRRFEFLIVSYNMVGKMALDLATRQFQLVICDESHSIKDSKAQRTKQTVPLLEAARRTVLLTGTPALSRPKEIFTQLHSLLPGRGIKFKAFAERYCLSERPDKWDPYKGASNVEELHRLLTGTVMVRRLKKDVMTQLPAKRRQQVYLTLDDKAMRELNKLCEELEAVRKRAMAAEDAGGRSAKADMQKATNEAYLRTAELKVPAVQEYIKDLLDSDQKFLAFAHHTSLLDGMETAFRKEKVRFIRIDGSTDPSKRSELVKHFQEQHDVRGAILSIKAAGVGLTLTEASLVVFAEYSWTPGDMVQAEDRAHRIGQRQSVNVQYLHVKKSIDDVMWKTLATKLDNVGQVLDGAKDALHVEAAATVEAPLAADQGRLDAFLVSTSPVVGSNGLVVGGDMRKRSASAVTAREPLLPRGDMQAGADAVGGRDAKRSRPF